MVGRFGLRQARLSSTTLRMSLKRHHTYRLIQPKSETRDNRLKYMQVLAENRVGPAIIEVTDRWVDIEKHKTMGEWLEQASKSQISRMRSEILLAIRKVHSLGFCHRDLHLDNLLVGSSSEPLIIDPEHAYPCNSTSKCYDLYGPSESVPLPPAHVNVGGVIGTTGIWWGAEYDPRFGLISLAMLFGPLNDQKNPI
jgi:RIO-like serine/threonine protein kinase